MQLRPYLSFSSRLTSLSRDCPILRLLDPYQAPWPLLYRLRQFTQVFSRGGDGHSCLLTWYVANLLVPQRRPTTPCHRRSLSGVDDHHGQCCDFYPRVAPRQLQSIPFIRAVDVQQRLPSHVEPPAQKHSRSPAGDDWTVYRRLANRRVVNLLAGAHHVPRLLRPLIRSG